MPAVLVPLIGRGGSTPVRALPGSSGRAVLVAGGFAVTLPWWPSDVSWSSLADTWTEVPRPGRDPLLVREARTLPEVRVAFLAAAVDGSSVQPLLDDLRTLAGLVTPVQMMLGARDAGLFRVTDLSIMELDHVTTGDCARADVEMTLKEADSAAPLGPVKAKGKRRPTRKRGR